MQELEKYCDELKYQNSYKWPEGIDMVKAAQKYDDLNPSQQMKAQKILAEACSDSGFREIWRNYYIYVKVLKTKIQCQWIPEDGASGVCLRKTGNSDALGKPSTSSKSYS